MGSNRRYWALWWLIAALSLWLRTGFPIHAAGTATHDDMLFIREARFLGAGEWLGPFGVLTLAKGMFYPLFILIAFVLAIPLNLAEQAVYLGAAAFAGRSVLRMTDSRGVGLTLFALLAFNPIMWNSEMDRVIREGLYLSLSLGVVLLAARVGFPAGLHRGWRGAMWGAAFGLLLGAFWLTREEGPWILPALAVTIMASMLCIGRSPGSLVPSFSAWLRTIGLPIAVAAAMFFLTVGAVAAMNQARYGVFITNEFKAAPFLRAYGALARIGQDHWQRYVVFPKDARERAYAVSPAARELKPVLDGPAGARWARAGCVLDQAAACPEIPSDLFMWAFREAVASAGHYTSAREAMRFYDRLAREIDAACGAGRIPCGPARATMMPVFRWEYLGDAARDAVPIGLLMLTLAGNYVAAASSEGPESALAILADMAGDIYPPYQSGAVLTGWAASPAGAPHADISSRTDGQLDTTASRNPAQDMPGLPPGWSAVRFDFRTSCAPNACDLVVAAPGEAAVTIPLGSGLAAGSAVNTPTLRVFFDYAAFRDLAEASAQRRAAQRKIAATIGRIYARVFPVASALAVVGLVLSLVRFRTRPTPPALLALAVASAAAIVARLALLAYLDVTSIPAANLLYPSAASPFVIMFAVSGCWCLLRLLMPSRPGTLR